MHKKSLVLAQSMHKSVVLAQEISCVYTRDSSVYTQEILYYHIIIKHSHKSSMVLIRHRKSGIAHRHRGIPLIRQDLAPQCCGSNLVLQILHCRSHSELYAT